MTDKSKLCSSPNFLLYLDHRDVLYFYLEVLRIDSGVNLLYYVVEKLSDIVVCLGRDVGEIEGHFDLQQLLFFVVCLHAVFMVPSCIVCRVKRKSDNYSLYHVVLFKLMLPTLAT